MKIGDRVRVISGDEWHGAHGEVTDIHNDLLTYPIDVKFEGYAYTVPFHGNELEVLEDDNAEV